MAMNCPKANVGYISVSAMLQRCLRLIPAQDGSGAAESVLPVCMMGEPIQTHVGRHWRMSKTVIVAKRLFNTKMDWKRTETLEADSLYLMPSGHSVLDAQQTRKAIAGRRMLEGDYGEKDVAKEIFLRLGERCSKGTR